MVSVFGYKPQSTQKLSKVYSLKSFLAFLAPDMVGVAKLEPICGFRGETATAERSRVSDPPLASASS